MASMRVKRTLPSITVWIVFFAAMVFPFVAASAQTSPTVSKTETPASPKSTGIDMDAITQPGFRVYNNTHGLPQNSVRAIAFDRKGYLWVGTQDGAAFYNGNAWKTVQFPPQAASRYIRSLLAASDGSLWFGTDGGGALQFKDNQWMILTTQNGLPNNVVRCLLETTSPSGGHALWVGTDAGVARFENNVRTVYDATSGLPNNIVWAMLETRDGAGKRTIWTATEGGLVRFDEPAAGRWVPRDVTAGLPSKVVYGLRQSVAPSGKPRLWVCTEGGLACSEGSFDSGRWTSCTTKNSGLPNDVVMDVLDVPSEDTLWAATYGGGLACRKHGRWIVYDIKSGFPTNHIGCLHESVSPDGLRTVWVGTYSGGLARFVERKWQVLSMQLGFRNNIVACFLETTAPDGSSVVWVGTTGSGVARLHAGKWTTFDTLAGLPGNVVPCLLETRTETGGSVIWAGVYGGGLARFENGRWRVFAQIPTIPNNWVISLAETVEKDGTRRLWAGTYGGGLACLEFPKPAAGQRDSASGTWKTFTSENSGLPNNWVLSLAVTYSDDRTPILWAGTRTGGLGRYENGVWTTIGTQSGLPSNWVWGVTERRDSSGRRTLWVGTNNGAARIALDVPGLPAAPLADAVPELRQDQVVYKIVEDLKKQLYLCTNQGIVRLTPRSPTPDDRSEFKVYTFTTEDGLPNVEGAGTAGTDLVDRAGRVWLGTVAGGVVHDPTAEIDDRAQKTLYVEQASVRADGRPLIDGESLAHDRNHLVFEYALLSFFRESDTRYRTQLVGLEKEPTAWTKDAKREFTTLPEGAYTFKVWGRDYNGNVSGPATVAFRVRPAPWRTWTAYAAYLLAVGAAGYWTVSRRIRAIRRRQNEKLAHLREAQEHRMASLRQLLESIRVINSELDLGTVLQNIAEESAHLIDGQPGGIALVESSEVVFRRLWLDGEWRDLTISFPMGQGIAGRVAETGKPLIVNDPESSPHVHFPEIIRRYGVVGLAMVPIPTRTGKIVGVLAVSRKPKGREFTEADCGLIESLAHQAAVAIEKASLYGELEKLYRQEVEVTAALKEVNRMKTNFIVVTSHEMRTPLTVLKGYTEALHDGWLGPLTESQKNSLATCMRMVERMNSTFEKILEMLKINEGRLKLNPTAVEIKAAAAEVVGEFASFAERRRLKLLLDGPEHLRISVDPEKFRLVLENLIQNAVKFTPDGGTISVNVERENSHARLTVADTGIGIEPGEIDHIFDMFHTSPDTSSHTSGRFEFSARGAGLGLSIVKSYVVAQGGRIWVESPGVGRGSRFHLVFPVCDGMETVRNQVNGEW